MADSVPRMLPEGDTSPAGLVDVLLTISPTGTLLLRPVYGADGKLITDLSLIHI